jgi:hypothetical protein
MGAFKYEVEQCDVRDKAQCAAFRAKFAEWMHWLQDDENSVFNQIHAMTWHCAVFQTINESRRLAEGRPSAALNGMVAEFIDDGFVAIQALAVRRLLEKPARREDRQIISLRRVLDDIFANRAIITREMYVCHDGLPYEFKDGLERRMHHLMREMAGKPKSERFAWGSTVGPEAFSSSKRVHKEFDALAGVKEDQRLPDDVICDEIFWQLNEILAHSGHEEFKTLADKTIAHAGDARSRELAAEARRAFTLQRLAACHKAIFRVTNFIGGSILGSTNIGGFPHPQFNQFEHLNHAWCRTEDLSLLQSNWDAYVAEVEGWGSTETSELLASLYESASGTGS